MKNKFFLIFCTVLCSFLCVTGCSHSSYLESDDETDISVDEEAAEDESEFDEKSQTGGEIFVQVAGAVNSPGVYALSDGSRIYDAIEAAEGLAEDADDMDINQAALLSDGQKIYVYRQGEREEAGIASEDTGGTASSEGSGLININSATLEELKTLSGIGDTKANSIISYREENGGFSRIEDLMNVDGIGQGTFDKLKEHITV